jgi:hypothetical protein
MPIKSNGGCNGGAEKFGGEKFTEPDSDPTFDTVLAVTCSRSKEIGPEASGSGTAN